MPKHKPIKFETTGEPTLKREVERIVKENPKAKSILNATLALAVLGGVLTIGAVAPGVLGGLARMSHQRKKAGYDEYQKIWHSFNNLKKQGEFKFMKEKDGYLVYGLSGKGNNRVKKLVFNEMKIRKPQKWDNRWRLVIFDIPESYSNARNALRKKLIELGFYQCQKSVWIHPFVCLEEVEFIKEMLNIKPFVKLFLVEEMTDGKALYHFRNLIKEVVVK